MAVAAVWGVKRLELMLHELETPGGAAEVRECAGK
jgi:hypothetical protein